MPLTDSAQEVVLERGGSIVIPALCYHSVIIPDAEEMDTEYSDMVAYLPDGDRYASDTYPGNK